MPVAQDAMGHAIGDWNMDGLMDWWMTAIHHKSAVDCAMLGCKFSDVGNIFHVNDGNRSLIDMTDRVRFFFFD